MASLLEILAELGWLVVDIASVCYQGDWCGDEGNNLGRFLLWLAILVICGLALFGLGYLIVS